MAWFPKGHQALMSQCSSAWDGSSFKNSWAAGAPRGTPSAIERHRTRVEVALSEIDGLIAGLHFQDRAEGGSRASYDSIYPSELPEDDFKPPAPLPSPPQPEPDMRSQPNAPQWQALRTLKQESEFHHARFKTLASDLGNPIISELLEEYPDAQKIRNTGAQLVKDVLEGFHPDKLSHVFVFTCFTYAISQVLHKKGRMDKISILADIRAWRALIRDKDELRAFNSLAPALWPESREHCHFIDVDAPWGPGISMTSAGNTSHRGNAWPSVVSTTAQLSQSQLNGHGVADQLLPPGIVQQVTAGSDYLPALNSTNPVNSDDLFPLIDLMNSSHEEIDFSNMSWMEPSPLSAPLLPADVPPLPDDADTLDPREKKLVFTAHERPEETALTETVMFLVVLAFLQEIGGQFLHILSGGNRSSGRYRLFSTQKGDQEAFSREVQESFQRLCAQQPSSNSSVFRALISVAEMLTRRGHLRTVAEIKHYLIALATAALPPGPEFENFTLALLAGFSVTNVPRKRKRSEDDDPPRLAKRKCKVAGCNKDFYDASGLWKHEQRAHKSPGSSVIH